MKVDVVGWFVRMCGRLVTPWPRMARCHRCLDEGFWWSGERWVVCCFYVVEGDVMVAEEQMERVDGPYA